jgi:hypothetical protein
VLREAGQVYAIGSQAAPRQCGCYFCKIPQWNLVTAAICRRMSLIRSVPSR